MLIEQKLKELIQSRYKSIREFAIEIDIPYSTIDSIFKRGIDKANITNIIKICQNLKISTDELADGRITHVAPSGPAQNIPTPAGQRIGRLYDKAEPRDKRVVETVLEPYDDTTPTKKAPSKTEDAEIAAELHVDTKKIVYIGSAIEDDEGEDTTPLPVYDEPAAAGFGNYLDEYAAQEDVDFPASVVPYNADFGIRISGDSMEPEIADGAIVFVEERLEINDGEIGIFVLNGDAYCKRLDVDKRRREVRLVSENEEYEDIIVREHDTLSTVGRVLGSYLPPEK